MAFIGLNKDLAINQYYYPLNVQWRRNYASFGTFEIQMVIGDYDKETEYVVNSETNEIALINKIDYHKTTTAEIVNISGYFYDYKFVDSVAMETFTNSTNKTIQQFLEEKIQQAVTDQSLPVDIITSGERYADVMPDMDYRGEIGTLNQDILKSAEMFCKCTFSFDDHRIKVQIVRGLDRTQDQSANEFCTWSNELGNIEECEVTNDNSNYKNVMVVEQYSQDDPSVSHKIVYVYLNDDVENGNVPKRTAYMEYSGASTDSTAVVKNLMAQEGLLELQKNAIVNNYSFKVLNYAYVYLQDYDLGDKCDLIISTLGVQAQARITSIYEVYKKNTRTIELTFGEPKVKAYQKRRY